MELHGQGGGEPMVRWYLIACLNLSPVSRRREGENAPLNGSPDQSNHRDREYARTKVSNETIHHLAMVATKSGRQRESPPSGDGGYQERPATRQSTIWRWWLPKAAGNETVHRLAMVATKSGRQRDSPPSGDGSYQEHAGSETVHHLAMVAKKKWPSGQNNRGDTI